MADKVVKLVSSRGFQDVGTIGQTTAQLSGNIQSINAVIDVGLRNTRNIGDSFVRVNDLVDMGIGTLDGNQFFVTPASGGLSTVNVQYSISGDGSVSTPLQLVNDTASPGANKVYGTDGSGVRGWQAASGGSSPLTTKGDLFGFDTADNRIPVGSNGKVLTADSTAAVGVSWQTPSSGGTTNNFFDGSNPYNENPDTHPLVPIGIGLGPNDEFEGTSIDTIGTRYSGATPWTAFSSGPASSTMGQGLLGMVSSNGGPNTQGYSQPIVGATWEYTCKLAANPVNTINGMFISVAGGNQSCILIFGNQFYVQHRSNPTTFVANVSGPANPTPTAAYYYLRVAYNGTNITYSYSSTGYDFDFSLLYTETPGAFLGAVPTLVGISVDANGGGVAATSKFDWFRATPSAPFVVTTGALPGTIRDLAFWWESDDILQSASSAVSQMRQRVPWITGIAATGTAGGIATVDAVLLNSLPVLAWQTSFPMTASFATPAGCTFFVVARASSAGTRAIIGGSTNGMALYLDVSSGGKMNLVKSGAAIVGVETTGWSSGIAFQANVTYDPATGNYAFRRASAANGSGTGATAGNAGTSFIGSDLNTGSAVLGNCSLAAVICFTRVLTAPEITAMEAYLLAKWGV